MDPREWVADLWDFLTALSCDVTTSPALREKIDAKLKELEAEFGDNADIEDNILEAPLLVPLPPCKVCGTPSALTFCSDDCENVATGQPVSKTMIRDVLVRLTKSQRLQLHILRNEALLKKAQEDAREHRFRRTRTFL